MIGEPLLRSEKLSQPPLKYLDFEKMNLEPEPEERKAGVVAGQKHYLQKKGDWWHPIQPIKSTNLKKNFS